MSTNMEKKPDNYFQLLMESMVKDFNDLLNVKLANIAFDDCRFKELFDFELDKPFYEIINAIGNISIYNPVEVIDWLISFRNSNLSKMEEVNKNKSHGLKPTTENNYSSHNSYNNHEIYECTYVVCLKEILPRFRVQLERSHVLAILNTMFDIIKKSCISFTTDEEKENHEYIMTNCGFVVNHFSVNNLNDIQDIFFKQLNSPTNYHQSNSIVLLLRYLRIRTYLTEHVETCFAFLMQCSRLMVKAKEKELKYSFYTMFSDILLAFASTAKAELNILNVKKFVDNLLPISLEVFKKTKNFHFSAPFVTAILCCTQRAGFFAQYQNILIGFLQFVKLKDISICKTSLECIHRIIWVYFVRYKGEDNVKTSKFLTQISNNLFNTSRTILFIEFPHLLVKIIHTLSLEQQYFVVEEIILELCYPPSSKHHCPEKFSVGIKAFMVIIDSLLKTINNTDMDSSNDYIYQTTRFSTLKNVIKLDDTNTFQQNLVVQLKHIQNNVYQTLIYLDSIIGKPFMKTSPMAPQKFGIEQLSNEKRLKIILFKHCIAYILKFPITIDMIHEVSDLLARLTLHIDEDMRMRASVILKVLIVERASFRVNVISSVIHTYLREIPDTFPNVMENAIKNITELIQIWRTCVFSEKKETTDEDYLETISISEGFCLIMLCNTYKSLRILACQTLREIKFLINAVSPNNKSDCCLHDQLMIYFYKSFPKKDRDPSDLSSFVEKISEDSSWSRILGDIFNKLKKPLNIQLPLKFAQSHCIIRFNTSHIQIESCTDPLDNSTILSNFSRVSKKIPNYCDTPSWQCYLLLFCAPTYFDDQDKKIYEKTISLSRNSSDNTSQERLKMIKQVFDKAAALFRSDYAELREMSSDALSFTSYSLVDVLFDFVHPLIRELSDVKFDLSIRKKKKRDSQILLLLKMFEMISLNGNLAQSAKYPNATHLLPLLEFCEICRSTLIPSLEYENCIIQARICIANIITGLSRGLFFNKKSDIFSPSLRSLFYRSFVNWLSILPDQKQSTPDKEESIIRAIFILLYKESILDDEQFSIKLPHLFQQIDRIILKNVKEYDAIIHEALEVLLYHNIYSKYIVDWLFFNCYANTTKFSKNIFFLVLEYFEKSNTVSEYLLIRIICLIFISSHNLDSVTYLRLRKTLVYIQRAYFLNSVSYNLPIPQQEVACNFTSLIIQHIKSMFSSHFIAIVNELFSIFADCHPAYQMKIFFCFQILFRQFIINIFPDIFCETPCKKNTYSVEKKCVITPDVSIMIINNFLYLTYKYSSNFYDMFKLCWISLCSECSTSFNSILHYLSAIAQHNLPSLHLVIKKVFEFIFQNCGPSIISYICYHLKASNHFKPTINSSKKYPYFILKGNYNLVIKRSTTEAGSKRCQSMASVSSNDENFNIPSNSKIFYYPFTELLEINSTQILQPYNVLLLFSSYVIPLGALKSDEDIILLLHFSIAGLYNSIETVSVSCKIAMSYILIFILNSSKIDEKIKLKLALDFNSVICSLQSDIIPKFCSLHKNEEMTKNIEKCSADLINYMVAKSEIKFSDYNEPAECTEIMFIDLINAVCHFFELCDYPHLVNDYWCAICTTFSTQSQSINISCYSLATLVALQQPLSCEKLKIIFSRYCEAVQETAIEIKKYSNELFKTILEISERVIKKVQEKPSDFDEETKEILGISTWFFILKIDLNAPDTILCFDFINQLLDIDENILYEIFDFILDNIKTYHGLFFSIIKSFFHFPTFFDNFPSLLIKILPLMSHQFIVNDQNLGEVLTQVIFTFYYLDQSLEQASEIPAHFIEIIKKLISIPRCQPFGKIYKLFLPVNKRKDMNVFLRLVCLEFIRISSATIIKVVLNFLTDIIKMENVKYQYIGIVFLNSIIKIIGSTCFSDKSINQLLDIFTKFSKIKKLSNICLESAHNLYNDNKVKNNECLHVALKYPGLLTEDSLCKLCSVDDNFIFVFYELISPNLTEISEFSSKEFVMKIKKILGNSHESSKYAGHISSKKKIFTDVSDFSDGTLQASLMGTCRKFDDESSINSNQLMEEIVNALNYLEDDLEKNTFNSSVTKLRESFSDETLNTRANGSKDIYSHASNFKKMYAKMTSLSQDMLLDVSRENQTNEIILNSSEILPNVEMVENEAESLQISRISNILISDENPKTDTFIADVSNTENDNKCIIQLINSEEISPFHIYLCAIRICMYFSDDNYLKDQWYNTCIQLLSTKSKNYNKEVGNSVKNIFFLFTSMVYRFVYILEGLLTNMISSKLFNNAFLDEEWSNLSFKNISLLIRNMIQFPTFPYLLIVGEYDFIDFFINKNGFNFILSLSSLINDFFNSFNLLIQLHTDVSSFNQDSFNVHFSRNQANLLFRSIFERFIKCMNNRPTFYKLHSTQYCSANFVIYFLYNILNQFSSLLGTYNEFIISFEQFICSHSPRDISQQCNDKSVKEIPTDMFNFIQTFESEYSESAGIFTETNNFGHLELIDSIKTCSSSLSLQQSNLTPNNLPISKSVDISYLNVNSCQKVPQKIVSKSQSLCFSYTKSNKFPNTSSTERIKRSFSDKDLYNTLFNSPNCIKNKNSIDWLHNGNFNSYKNWENFRSSVLQNLLTFFTEIDALSKENAEYTNGRIYALIGSVKSLQECNQGLISFILQFLSKINT